MDKRTFLTKSTVLGLGSLVSMEVLGKAAEAVSRLSQEAARRDDDFWASELAGVKREQAEGCMERGWRAEEDDAAMLDMFKQTSKRYGMVNKIVSIPMDPKSDEEIVELYANAITPKTRLLMVCHMINITGHILPVRKICDMAHER